MKIVLTITMVIGFVFSINGQTIKATTQQWTGFMQGKDASFLKEKTKFKISASVKLMSGDPKASANIWARVYKKGGETNFFYTEITLKNSKPDAWQNYSLEGYMDEKSESVYFGGMCEYNGKFYFDSFEMTVENAKGVFEKATLDNAGFETTTSTKDRPVQGWAQGVSRGKPLLVEGFTLSINPDHADGNYSLLMEGKNVKMDSSYFIIPAKGYSPQIGSLVMMLNNLSNRAENQVATLDPKDTDFLLDENANSVGALIMHLAAAEAYYQVFTFENRGFNEEERKKWQVAMDLGEEARKTFKGHDIEYYLAEYRAVRKKTLEELGKRDDAWLLQNSGGYEGMNNYYSWFHVMEHQSSHLGQILLLKKRMPKKDELLIAPPLNLEH